MLATRESGNGRKPQTACRSVAERGGLLGRGARFRGLRFGHLLGSCHFLGLSLCQLDVRHNHTSLIELNGDDRPIISFIINFCEKTSQPIETECFFQDHLLAFFT